MELGLLPADISADRYLPQTRDQAVGFGFFVAILSICCKCVRFPALFVWYGAGERGHVRGDIS